MNTDITSHAETYEVKLVECAALSDDERTAAELRFRMALEFGLGGPEQVVPSLQAYLLAESLNDDLPLEEPSEAEEQMIALWKTAEADAILTAFRPFNKDMGDARFEIVPL